MDRHCVWSLGITTPSGGSLAFRLTSGRRGGAGSCRRSIRAQSMRALRCEASTRAEEGRRKALPQQMEMYNGDLDGDDLRT